MINKNILIHRHEHKHKVSVEELHRAYKIFFGTLVSESRLKIINFLRNKKMNVSEIMKGLKSGQTAVSHDLQRLKKCGFVSCEIDGKFRYYRLNEKTIKPLMNIIDRHMSEYCVHILKKMKGGDE